ncbi:GNAT family N-acetyltransferase [Streptomyces sp. NPDC056486]|uniref:GNAT family N-acetyltransferase n=1 Tax=Streptomyces sp. NPDC056486 TaxID=3345835 RepID=UPI0036BFA26F
MELIYAKDLGTDVTYRHWKTDLHRPEVLLRSGRQQVRAVLEERRGDGTTVFSVVDPREIDELAPDGRLAVLFRADRSRYRKRKLAPVHTREYAVDRNRAVVEARFPVQKRTGRAHPLVTPIAASLKSAVLYQRLRRISLVRLSTYGGEFVTEDPGRCLSPGMSVDIDSWLPWLGHLRLRAQLTGCQEQLDGVHFQFALADRGSVRTAAIVLTGTSDGFGFGDLRDAGVRPSRVTKYLTVQTVSDTASFRQALDVRLVGNRRFGRLADVDDGTEVADHLDPHAVNFICLLGDKALGTGRVVVNSGSRALSEIENETTGLPVHIWRGGFVEVSRLAIHPDYRGAGVVVALFREVARLAFHLDCRYLVLDAIEKLVPVYQKIGAQRLPISKTHPYSKETVRVMAVDIAEQLGRLDRKWLSWQYVFGPPVRHHLDTASPHALTRFVRGLGVLPFALKRALSRVQ